MTRINSDIITKAAYLLFYKKRGIELNFEQILAEARSRAPSPLKENVEVKEEETSVTNFSWDFPPQTQTLVGPWDRPMEVASLREPSTARNSNDSLNNNGEREASVDLDNLSFKSFEADAASTVNSLSEEDTETRDQAISEWPPSSNQTSFYEKP